MAGPRGGYHQEYIARIRYSNELPPPPFPPKLLQIPNTGLVDGPYTGSNYAARLAREQPINVDADAFGGMEINLIGLKGAFEGNDATLYFEDYPPPIDPADRPLLRPLEMIGKPAAIKEGVTFLRRTEYSSGAGHSAKKEQAANAALRAPPRPRPQARPANPEDPISILRNIVKGFDVAYPSDAYTGQDNTSNLKGQAATNAEKAAWARPRHPSRRDLTLLDAYPLLPDLDAIPEEGGYAFCRFQQNPGTTEDAEDETVHVSLLRPLDAGTRFELFVPENPASVPNIKRKFDVADPEADEDELYDYVNGDSGEPCFRYKRVRVYQHERVDLGANKFGDSIALALHDSDSTGDRLGTGAYMYPISSRGRLVAERPKKVAAGGYAMPEEEEERVDFVLATIKDPPEAVVAKMEGWKAAYEPAAA